MSAPAPTILIAEDSRFLRRATELILAKAGYTVLTAADGKEALEIAQSSLPQLIVLDLMMPRLNGVEVIRALKEEAKTSAIPVLVLTALSQRNDQKLVQAGATAYYEKTKLIPETLVEIVKKTLVQSAAPQSAQIERIKSSGERVTSMEAERETLLVSGSDNSEYERQIFEQLIAVNNELLIAQRELASVNEELLRVSGTDELTGLSNRRKSTEDIVRLLSLARRQKTSLCLALLDVDRFKDVNDRFGHAAGDAVLRGFASLMLRLFRSEDVVGRWGGEEFVIALYACSLPQATARLERLRGELCGKPFIVDEATNIEVTLSAGVVAFPEAGADLERLCHAADTALYMAKRGGRNRIVTNPSTTNPASSAAPPQDRVRLGDFLWHAPAQGD